MLSGFKQMRLMHTQLRVQHQEATQSTHAWVFKKCQKHIACGVVRETFISETGHVVPEGAEKPRGRQRHATTVMLMLIIAANFSMG